MVQMVAIGRAAVRGDLGDSGRSWEMDVDHTSGLGLCPGSRGCWQWMEPALSLVTCGSCAITLVALGSRLLPASDWPWLWGSQVPEASE